MKYSLFALSLLSTIFCKCEKESENPVDGDGNVYDTVVIGTQVWLTENLKTTKYNNGVSIPLVTGDSEWALKTSAAFCWYSNDQSSKNDYGALYNWYTVTTNLCPVGYHVPTEAEWTTMINYLGTDAGAKLKDNDPRFWIHFNYCASNETGFGARPAGYRVDEFLGIKERCFFWTSSLSNWEGQGMIISFRDESCQTEIMPTSFYLAASVRCIKN